MYPCGRPGGSDSGHFSILVRGCRRGSRSLAALAGSRAGLPTAPPGICDGTSACLGYVGSRSLCFCHSKDQRAGQGGMDQNRMVCMGGNQYCNWTVLDPTILWISWFAIRLRHKWKTPIIYFRFWTGNLMANCSTKTCVSWSSGSQ